MDIEEEAVSRGRKSALLKFYDLHNKSKKGNVDVLFDTEKHSFPQVAWAIFSKYGAMPDEWVTEFRALSGTNTKSADRVRQEAELKIFYEDEKLLGRAALADVAFAVIEADYEVDPTPILASLIFLQHKKWPDGQVHWSQLPSMKNHMLTPAGQAGRLAKTGTVVYIVSIPYFV